MAPARRSPSELLEQARRGDRSALARLLSMVERGGEPMREVARLAYRVPPPYTLGLTGAPGAGKSTLTSGLLGAALGGWPSPSGGAPDASAAGDAAGSGPERADAAGSAPEPADAAVSGREPVDQVAVLAVDPTSPFSGGAILGDRVRMQDHATDPSVYVRSLASRGHLGGLALAVPDGVRVLGASGFPLVLVETVGVGQVEVEVAGAVDTTIVVVNPGWGDAVQANKAGLLEVADLFVVNKADRPGARETRRDLEQMLDLTATGDPRPPIIETVASSGEGIDRLWEAIAEHRRFLTEGDRLGARRAARTEHELRRVVVAQLGRQADQLLSDASSVKLREELAGGGLDPYDAADELLTRLGLPT